MFPMTTFRVTDAVGTRKTRRIDPRIPEAFFWINIRNNIQVSFLLVPLSYDNFSSYSVRRYSLDETDRSAHPGSAEVVIKPITSSNESPRWAQWPRVAGRGGLRRVFILKNDLLKCLKCVFC